ncbi:UrcA family protein [Sphingomonas sp. GC_Shp_4]|uniref:UrcA family protein n=2 Tax=unclassified Sphingomonas TaxID=196159 RepID=UPI00226BB665|nr:UrcA family protein [Sphingomonas sp. GC_Shp_4]
MDADGKDPVMISNSQRFVCSVLSIAGAASLVAFASPAHATATRPSDVRQAVVKYGDLDLGNPADRARFATRASRAADQVCTVSGASLSMAELACRQAAIEQARRGAGLDARG